MKRFFASLLFVTVALTASAQTYVRLPASRLIAVSDTTAPTLTSTTVSSDGVTVTTVFSEPVNKTSYTTGDLNIDGTVTNNNLTYSSGNGTNTLVWTAASTIMSGETLDIDFNGAANSIEDLAGNDLAAITNASVFNGSSQSGFTQRDTVTGTSSGTNNFCFDSNVYLAGNFTAGGTYTITKAVLPMKKIASPTFNIQAAIFTNNSGQPGTLVGTASGIVLANTLSTSFADVTFTGMSASLTSGTVYWIVIFSNNAPGDFTNYAIWDSISGGGSDFSYKSPDGSAWAQYQNFNKQKMTLYSTP